MPRNMPRNITPTAWLPWGNPYALLNVVCVADFEAEDHEADREEIAHYCIEEIEHYGEFYTSSV